MLQKLTKKKSYFEHVMISQPDFGSPFFFFLIQFMSLTVLSFFHLWIRPRIPEVTDSSPSDGGCKIIFSNHNNYI